MIAIDTNLLVYAFRRDMPEHRRAQRALEKAMAEPDGWGVAYSCLVEFWSVVTHAAAAGGAANTFRTAAFVDTLCREGGAQIWFPGPGFAARLCQLAADQNICGGAIFDLQIALMAFDHGASELWTHDRGFRTIAGLRVIDPLAD
jgi:hypothetical protein